MKVTVRKGGEGSGFHGHAGRPGEVGGSSSNYPHVKFVDKWDDLSQQHSFLVGSRAAIILGNDKMVDMSGFDHADYIRNISDPSVFGLTASHREVYSMPRKDLFGALFASGGFRVRSFSGGGEVAIQSGSITTQMLGRIQRLHDEGKLKFANKVTWSDSQGGKIYTTYEEFMNAKRVISTDGNYELKEDVAIIRLKGGEGSGFHGHAGRPGMVGGSSPSAVLATNFGKGYGRKGEITDYLVDMPVNPVIGTFNRKVVGEHRTEHVYSDDIRGRVKVYRGLSAFGQDAYYVDRNVEDKIATWMSRHDPVVATTINQVIVCDTEEDFAFVYNESGGNVPNTHIIGGFFDQTTHKVYMKRSAFTNGIFDHEVGHGVYYSSKMKDYWNAQYHADRTFDRVTLYARTNDREGFAEGYAAYVAARGRSVYARETRTFKAVMKVLDGL